MLCGTFNAICQGKERGKPEKELDRRLAERWQGVDDSISLL
jgi:hypothetical protein